MNHTRVIFGKCIRTGLVGVAAHIRIEITPINNLPTFIQKHEGLGWARRGQSSGLEEDAIRRGQTTIGAGEPAEVKIHGSAAEAGLTDSIHENVTLVRGTSIDRSIF